MSPGPPCPKLQLSAGGRPSALQGLSRHLWEWCPGLPGFYMDLQRACWLQVAQGHAKLTPEGKTAPGTLSRAQQGQRCAGREAEGGLLQTSPGNSAHASAAAPPHRAPPGLPGSRTSRSCPMTGAPWDSRSTRNAYFAQIFYGLQKKRENSSPFPGGGFRAPWAHSLT